MNTRLFLLVRIFEASLVLVAVYFEPTYLVRAYLRDDAFFEDKPTSWWRDELHRYEIHQSEKWVTYHRHDSFFEKGRDRLFGRKKNPGYIIDEIILEVHGPQLIRGEPDAAPVLRQLLNDGSPKIRRFARIGLGMGQEDRP